MLASVKGHADVVARLLKAGAEIDARNDENQTALMLACSGGSAEVVRVLLEARADTNVRDRVKLRTPLQWVLRMREGSVKKKKDQIEPEKVREIMRLLLNYDTDVSLEDHKGKTALAWAQMHRWQEEIRVLEDAAARRKGHLAVMGLPSVKKSEKRSL